MVPGKTKKWLNEDSQKWVDFLLSLENVGITDYEKQMVVVIDKFRALLATRTYQALKDDYVNPYIQYIHRFAVALSKGVSVMDVHHTLGKKLADKDLPTNFDLETAEGRAAFVEASKNARHQARKENLVNDGWFNGSKFAYLSIHLRHALASLSAEKTAYRTFLESFLSPFGWEGFDPRKLGNHPSLQGTLIAGKGPDVYEVHTCYGGSPTINDHVAPEFTAVLQAIRNNNRIQSYETCMGLVDDSYEKAFPGIKIDSDDQLDIPKQNQSDESIPSLRVYINLQNIENTGGEAARARAIHDEAALRYPGELVVATLGKDSKFYDPHGKNKAPWTGGEDFGDLLLKNFSDNACYTHLNRSGSSKGHGMYLPGGKQRWLGDGTGSNGVLNEIVKLTKEYFNDTDFPPVPNDPELSLEYRRAFTMHVYLLIRGYLIIDAAESAQQAGLRPSVLSETSCKGDLDRGVSEKMVAMNAFLDREFEDERIVLTAGTGARALNIEERTILEHRVTSVEAHTKHVPPSVSKQHLERLCGLLKNSLRYVPAISHPKSNAEWESPLGFHREDNEDLSAVP